MQCGIVNHSIQDIVENKKDTQVYTSVLGKKKALSELCTERANFNISKSRCPELVVLIVDL